MAIKMSSLEKKWQYRVGSVFFPLLPFIILAFLIKEQINIYGMSQETITYLATEYGFYALIGVSVYSILLVAIWRIGIYIFFGGLIIDTRKKPVVQMAQASPQPYYQQSPPNKDLFWLPFLIILGSIIAGIYFSGSASQPQQSSSSSSTSTRQCVPTGCGSLYRCSGSYYSGTKHIYVSGSCFQSDQRPSVLYGSWSGICQKCPL